MHSGIKNDGSGLARIVVHGNIVDAAADARERDQWVPDQAGFNESASVFTNSLFVGKHIAWRSSEREDPGPFRSQMGKARPRFVDYAKQNFRYATADSPGVDASMEAEVYRIFEETYGLNITVDHDGRPRPQGRAWDIGAYEWR